MNRIYISLIAIALTIVASCSKDLNQEPISNIQTENFFNNSNDFLQATNAVYNALRGYPDRQLNLSETRSDNLYAVSDGGVRDWEGINDFYSSIATNPYVSEAWSSNYNGIYRANLLLAKLAEKGGVVTDTVLRKRLQAEAKFLRAFYYFDLVRWFGKVPLIQEPVELVTQALDYPRAPVADVYNLIISDLQYAAANLPAVQSTGTKSTADTFAVADRGRPTRYAAKGILALVYMTRSGPTYGIEGPGLGLNEWALAESLLNEIIASNNYTTLNSYSDIFSYSNEYNKEVVFDIEYSSGSNPVVGATFPWVLVPDNYFSAIGVTSPQGGLTIRPVSNNLLNSYESSDLRKNFSIQTGFTYQGTVETRSFFKKYVDITKVPTNRLDWPINFIVLRYTDVLLLKAECVLHGAPGNQATDVDVQVNKIRTRAGLTTPLVNVTLAQLMEERRKEFAAEGSRWHDLVRSGLVTTVIPAWIATEDVEHKIQPFNANYIIYAVPQSQLDIAPGLYTQNPGYQ